jgi:hypothetical protein
MIEVFFVPIAELQESLQTGGDETDGGAEWPI